MAITTDHPEAGGAWTLSQREQRPQTQLYLGFHFAEQGGIEEAIRAFRSALAATLDSNKPEDLRLRRAAASELVRLMRLCADEELESSSEDEHRPSGRYLIKDRRSVDSARERPRILVIDENETERAQMVGILKRAGFQVFELSSVLGATRRLVRHEIHALVADIELPGLAGGALVSLLRSNPQLSNLAVLLVAKGQPAALARIGREQAVKDVLDKEEAEEGLVKAVQRALLSQRIRRRSIAPVVNEQKDSRKTAG